MQLNRQPLLNGVLRNFEHPDSFHIPAPEIRSGLCVGFFAKVCSEGERFWCEITAVHGPGRYTGRVDNDLTRSARHGYRYNDVIEFESCHVLDWDQPHTMTIVVGAK